MAADTPAGGSLVGIDDMLGGGERSIRDTVRRLVRERLLSHVPKWFETGYLPREVSKEVGELGLLGMHLQGYGCADTSGLPTAWPAWNCRPETAVCGASYRSKAPSP